MRQGKTGSPGPPGKPGQPGGGAGGKGGVGGRGGDPSGTGGPGGAGGQGGAGGVTESLRGPLRFLVLSTVLLYVALAGLGIYFVLDSRAKTHALQESQQRIELIAAQGKEAHDGACALRFDVENRIVDSIEALERSENFLRAHPMGIPGISRAVFLAGISRQKATLVGQQKTAAALAGLHCG